MALSGSYDFTVNCQELIKAALRALGVIATGETPTNAEIADGREALNLLIKSWQGEGIGLWLRKELTLFLEYEENQYSLGPSADHATLSYVKTEIATAAASAAGSIVVDSITGISDGDYIGIELDDSTLQWTTVNGAPSGTTITLTDTLTDAAAVDNHVYAYTTRAQRPLGVLEARRVMADNNEIPITVGSRLKYMELANKTATGPPTQVYYDPQLTNGQLYVWQACDDVQELIKMTVQYPIQDFDANTDDADFPQEQLRALKFNLALDLAPEWGKEPSAFLVARAESTKSAVKGFDHEDTSVFFQPEGW